MKLLNKTRSSSKVGYLVKSVSGGFQYAGYGDTPIGVVTEVVPSGAMCEIQTSGTAKVYVNTHVPDGTDLRMTILDQGGQAGVAFPIGNASIYQSVGTALKGGRGLIDVALNLASAGVVGGTAGSLPAGGSTGQVLVKNSATDYDYGWSTFTAVGEAPYSASSVRTALGDAQPIIYGRYNGNWVDSGLLIDYSGGTGVATARVAYGERVTFVGAGSGISTSHAFASGVHTITITHTPAGAYYNGWFIDADTGGGGSDNVVSTALVTFAGGTYIDTSLVYATPGGTPPVTADVTIDLNWGELHTQIQTLYYTEAEIDSFNFIAGEAPATGSGYWRVGSTSTWGLAQLDILYAGGTAHDYIDLNTESLAFASSGSGLGVSYNPTTNTVTYTFTPAGSYYDGWFIDADSGGGGSDNVVSTALVTFSGGTNISTVLAYATPGGTPPVTAEVTFNLSSTLTGMSSISDYIEIVGTGTPPTGEARLYVNNNIAYSISSLATAADSRVAFRIKGRNTSTHTLAVSATDVDEYAVQVVNTAGTAAGDFAINPYGGNVGIGLRPDSYYGLDIGGDARFNSGGTVEGLLIQHSHVTANGSQRIMFNEGATEGLYGMSIIYAGDNNPTFKGTAFTLSANYAYFRMHNNSLTGTTAMSIDRVNAGVNLFYGGTRRAYTESNGFFIGGFASDAYDTYPDRKRYLKISNTVSYGVGQVGLQMYTDTHGWDIFTDRSTGYLHFEKVGATPTALGTEYMYISTAGLYHIGEIESYDTSDIRLKSNIETISYSRSARLLDVDVVEYDHIRKEKRQIGLIAQEIKEIFPEVVREDGDGYLMIQYGKLVAPMLQIIQNQDRRILELERRLAQY